MNKDDIEKIYSQLEGFSKEPPAELWDNIEGRLHPKPKKKRRGLIWFWGAAAAIIILLIGFNLKSSLGINDQPEVKVTDIENNGTQSIKNNKQLKEDTIENDTGIIVDNTEKNIKNEKSSTFENSSSTVVTSQDKPVRKNDIFNKNEKVANTKTEKEIPEENILNKDKKNNNENYALSNSNTDAEKVETNNDNILKKDNAILKQLNKESAVAINDSIVNEEKKLTVNSIEKLVAEKEDEKDNVEEERNVGLKWSVELLGGLSNTASDSYVQNTSVNTQSQNDFVYALRFGYAISDRLVVKSGIGKNILGQEVNNIAYASADASLGTDVSPGLVINNELSFYPNQEIYDEFTASPNQLEVGVLRQQLDFVQVPLEVSYSLLIDQKYNLSLGLGGNVNFLTNNRAYLNDEQIGESRNVESTIFGATINSNFSYKLSKNLNLFIEPSYNYFQKPVDNSSQNFQNTQFRALFGLRYGF